MCPDMAVTGGTIGGGDHGGTMGDSLFGVVCYKKNGFVNIALQRGARP